MKTIILIITILDKPFKCPGSTQKITFLCTNSNFTQINIVDMVHVCDFEDFELYPYV